VVEGGSLAGFWARKEGRLWFGSPARWRRGSVWHGEPSSTATILGVRAGEMVRSRARVCARVVLTACWNHGKRNGTAEVTNASEVSRVQVRECVRARTGSFWKNRALARQVQGLYLTSTKGRTVGVEGGYPST
jgi:hypothetical protein